MNRVITCERVGFRINIEYTDFFIEKIREISKIYNMNIEELICQIGLPSSRYYVRTNLLKASSDEVIIKLKRDGYQFFKDGRIEEAIYTFVDGPYEIEENPNKYVVVDNHTAESVLLGANVYAPGVLKIHGEIGQKVAIVNKKGNVVGIGRLINNPLKTGKRSGLVVELDKSPFKTPKLRETIAFNEGYIYDQSLPSMMVARAINPEPYDIIVDLTASPGGKITHAYELSEGKSLALGIDRTKSKVDRIKRNAERLGHNIYTFVCDSRTLPEKLPKLKASKIIVDPPCSDLGRRPKTSLLITSESLNNLVNLQRALLKTAVKMLSPGGLIVYSTCTLTYEENEKNAEWAIRELNLKAIEPFLPLPFSPLSNYPFVRFVPGIMDTPGFFISLFEKKQ